MCSLSCLNLQKQISFCIRWIFVGTILFSEFKVHLCKQLRCYEGIKESSYSLENWKKLNFTFSINQNEINNMINFKIRSIIYLRVLTKIKMYTGNWHCTLVSGVHNFDLKSSKSFFTHLLIFLFLFFLFVVPPVWLCLLCIHPLPLLLLY